MRRSVVLLAVLLLAAFILAGPSGCMTGRLSEKPTAAEAIQSDIAMMQLTLTTAEEAWEFWLTNHRQESADVIAAEQARREAAMVPIREALAALLKKVGAK